MTASDTSVECEVFQKEFKTPYLVIEFLTVHSQRVGLHRVEHEIVINAALSALSRVFVSHLTRKSNTSRRLCGRMKRRKLHDVLSSCLCLLLSKRQIKTIELKWNSVQTRAYIEIRWEMHVVYIHPIAAESKSILYIRNQHFRTATSIFLIHDSQPKKSIREEQAKKAALCACSLSPSLG